ncbi:MAG TPA: hypothetical protein PKY96_08040 [Flavobacteriales bacterium]|nr:hypothetical protein [Flavobacteriales bacterium]
MTPPIRFLVSANDGQGVTLTASEQALLSGESDGQPGEAIGLLSDTALAFHVLWLFPADDMLPMVSTFSKDGALIKAVCLAMGECHSDACYTCQETAMVDEQLRVLTTDTVKDCACDSTHNPIAGTCRRYVKVCEGLITEKGTFMAPVRDLELSVD